MAAATVNKRVITALGPIKMEFLNVTATNTNTIETHIQNPNYAMAVNNEDTDVTDQAINVAISGKTLTLNNDDLSSSEVNILVFGF